MTTQNIYDLVDTWNASGTTFTAVKMNVTNTASAAASRLIDLQIDTASRFNISKDGYLNLKGTLAEINIGYLTETNLLLQQGGPILAGNGALSWSSSNTAVSGGNRDLILTRRGAANLRLGAADAASGVQAQTLSVQSITGTNVSAAAYPFKITGAQGTGNAAGGPIVFQVAPAGGAGVSQNTLVDAWSISGAGHFLAGTDNIYDIGASGATRPRNVFVAGAISAGTTIIASGFIQAGSTQAIGFNARSYIKSASDGVLSLVNSAETDFSLLQFGGTSASFPALKRSTTSLQAVLANDTGFAGFASANMQAATAYTVATLPGTPGTGMIARVTDALAPTIGMTVAAGGAAYALVNYNGANWTVIGV